MNDEWSNECIDPELKFLCSYERGWSCAGSWGASARETLGIRDNQTHATSALHWLLGFVKMLIFVESHYTEIQKNIVTITLVNLHGINKLQVTKKMETRS